MLNLRRRPSIRESCLSVSSYWSYSNSSYSFDEGPIVPIFPVSFVSFFRPTFFKHYKIYVMLNGDNHLRFGGEPMWEGDRKRDNIVVSRVKILKPKYAQHLALEPDFLFPMMSREFQITLSEMIKSSKTLRSLDLDLQKCYNSSGKTGTKLATDSDLIWFGTHILRSMTNLKHFSIRFAKDSRITEDGLKVFCRLIGKNLKRLECLTLDFNRCNMFGDDCLKTLTHFASSYLRHLKELRILPSIAAPGVMKKIHFDKSRYLKNLQSLELYLCGRQSFWSRSIKEMSFGQNKFSNVSSSHLSLYFAPLRQESHDHVLQLLSSSVLKSLQTLKILDLDFEGLNMTKDAAQIFIEALNKKVHILEHFKLHLDTCELFTQEFFNSFKCPENNQLSKLEMQFEARNANSEQDLLPTEPLSTFISNSLKYFKNLTSLNLRFDLVQIKDQGAKALTSCIAQHLTKLESLNISFFWSSLITEETLTTFKEDFCAENALLNLKSLIITFSSCDNLTEAGVDSLRAALTESKPHIENMNVFFVDSNDSSWKPDEEEDSDDDWYDNSDDSDENGDDYIIKE